MKGLLLSLDISAKNVGWVLMRGAVLRRHGTISRKDDERACDFCFRVAAVLADVAPQDSSVGRVIYEINDWILHFPKKKHTNSGLVMYFRPQIQAARACWIMVGRILQEIGWEGEGWYADRRNKEKRHTDLLSMYREDLKKIGGDDPDEHALDALSIAHQAVSRAPIDEALKGHAQ